MENRIPEKCDVVVIGGGPAGALASGLLAKKGIDVVVLEKEQFPRYVTGESLIPHFWKYLDLIDVSEEVMNEGFVAKAGGATYWNGKFKKMSFADFGYKRPGLHVEREKFDDIILKRAEALGASVFYKMMATEIIHGNPLSKVVCKNLLTKEQYTIEAKYIIDASGQSALYSRKNKIRVYDEGFQFHSFMAFYRGGKYMDGNATVRSFDEKFIHRPLSLVSSIGDWGWVWQLVLREKTSIGIVLPKKRLADFKSRGPKLIDRIESYLKETPLIGDLMKDAKVIPESVTSMKDYSSGATQLTAGNVFMTGDAAAFVDPINSAGVVVAFYGGFLAAWSISRALNKPESIESIKEMYSSQLKQRFDLYRLLAFPSDLVSSEMTTEGRKILSYLDEEEIDLAMTQITLTNRAKNLADMLGVEKRVRLTEVPISEITI